MGDGNCTVLWRKLCGSIRNGEYKVKSRCRRSNKRPKPSFAVLHDDKSKAAYRGIHHDFNCFVIASVFHLVSACLAVGFVSCSIMRQLFWIQLAAYNLTDCV